MTTIELPWPPTILNPNTVGNWRNKGKARAKQKSDAYWLAYGKIKYTDGLIPVSITFHPPRRVISDLDNSLASIKGAMDGIAAAGGFDDKQFEPIILHRGEPGKPGKVVIKFGVTND